MNSSALTLLASASVTLLSIVVGAVSYLTLAQEDTGHVVSLGTLSPIPTNYLLREPSKPQGCFGRFSISITPTSSQTTIAVRGWVLVGINERVEPVNLEATMLFNALGQLGVSLLRTNYAGESVRLGTTGVNPISMQFYNGHSSDKPLFQHSVPGPVSLTLRDGAYELQVPPLFAFRGIPILGDSPLAADISVVPATPENPCDVANAHHIDLGPLTRFASSLQQTLPRVFSGL